MEEIVLTEEDVPGALLTKDPAEYTNEELKRWLECHGQKKGGRKPELIERVRGCIAIKTKVDPRIDGGKWYNIKKQSKERQNAASSSISVSSTVTASNDWKTFPSFDIPRMFNYGHVYHYLIESISQFASESDYVSDGELADSDDETGYTATAKPLRKGRKLVESGYVEDIQDNRSEQHYFLRAHVHHSMKNEYPLDVSVVLSNASGSVEKASCNCRASALSRCAHVSALLLSLVEYTESKGHQVTAPSTSKLCTWNRGKKRARNPNPIHEAQYKSRKSDDRKVYHWDPRPKEHRKAEISKEQLHGFIHDLQVISVATNEESMWETSLRITYQDYKLDDDRRTVLMDLIALFEDGLKPKYTPTENCYGAVEIPGTEEQSKSPAWFQERKFRLTASKCKDVCLLGDKLVSHKGDEFKRKFFNWISKNFWSPKFVQTRDMQYGITEEPKARQAYATATGNEVTETGLWVNQKFPYLAASPDGFYTDSKGETGLVEIKCLKILREKSVEDFLQQHQDGKISSESLNRQCFVVSDGHLKLRESHQYYYQVQLQLLVTNLDSCDFILHTPKGHPSVQRISSDKLLQNRIRQSLSAFWHKVLMPEFFEMRVPRNLLPFVL